jgi:hypothetical protein
MWIVNLALQREAGCAADHSKDGQCVDAGYRAGH